MPTKQNNTIVVLIVDIFFFFDTIASHSFESKATGKEN